MTKRRAFIIQYEQSLGEEADPAKPGWSEHKEISVRVTSDALTGGWIQQFGEYPIDYLVLNIISLHARPLADDDIALLKPFRLVTERDRGRLFAYITDLAIADILGKDRKAVGRATKRLAVNGHLTVRALNKDAQIRFKGRFNGNAIYILSGSVAIKKEIVGRETDAHRVPKRDTVDGESAFTVYQNGTYRVPEWGTNRRRGGEEEEHPPKVFFPAIRPSRAFAATRRTTSPTTKTSRRSLA